MIDIDDKDIAMVLITILAVTGSILIAYVFKDVTKIEIVIAAIATINTGAITAIAALATGRKKGGDK